MEASSDDEDNISKLPDDVIHHILSFVNVKQAVQTCVLSKRWTHVWTSLPFLNFDLVRREGEYGYNRFGYQNCIDFVDNVLRFRDSECFDIIRFHILQLYGVYGSYFMETLGRWIVVLAESNVEDVNVQFYGDISDDEEDFEVPDCVSTSKSLTKLELSLDKHKIIMSDSISLPRLKYLTLTKPSFNEDDITKLCSSCPALEHLDLSGITNTDPLNITISSLNLKHLELRIGYPWRNGLRNTLKLYAPNLVHLGLSNLDYMLLENVSRLVTADLQTSDALESLELLHNVQDLTISFQSLKDVRRVQELLQKQPFQFCNLQSLKLKKLGLSKDSMHVMESFLQISPIIESLALELCPDGSNGRGSKSEQDRHTSETTLELEGIFADTVKQLKYFEVMRVEGSHIELKFIEILMQNAVVLKKIVLKDWYRPRNKDFTKFCVELENFPSVSSSLRFYLYDIGAPVLRPRRLNPEFPNNTLESLKQLHNAKDLTASFQLVKDEVQGLLQKRPFEFSNLQRVKLQNISLSLDSMHVIATLLKILPVIESLTLELCQEVQTNEFNVLRYVRDYKDELLNDEDGFDERPDSGSESEQKMGSNVHTGETTLDLEGLFADTMKQLESVEITGLEGSDVELKLIEILMKNAMVLKKMVVKKDPCRFRNTKFHEELDKFPSASSSLKVYFYL